jgi:hypothetical protein
MANSSRVSTAWILLLTIASTATTLVFACATPFPAFAALAAVHMRRNDGVLLMIAAWVASQAVGFCALGYPQNANTLAWGAVIGLAAIGGVLAAGIAAKGSPPIRLVLAYVAAFVAFKVAILFASLALGGVGPALSVEIMVRQFVRNGAILIGLLALYHALTAVGVPEPRRFLA